MIDAAERLIAEKGLSALSLREVATEAGQRNHSAVQYHFGSRAGLVEAVFDVRMTPIDARRAEMLDALEATGGTDDLWALCNVFVRPLGEAVLLDRPGWWGRFLLEVYRSEPALLRAERPAMQSLNRVAALVIRRMDAVPAAIRTERIRMAVRAATSMFAEVETELATAAEGLDPPPVHRPELFIAHVVDLVHAMVAAPPSAVLSDELRASGLGG
jgi:AcrR family transcriptional regulator